MRSHEFSDADVVIAGTGAGGSTFGYALAAAGRSVLFLEQGPPLSGPTAEQPLRGMPPEVAPQFAAADSGSRERLFHLAGRNTETFMDDAAGDSFVPFIGSGTGGSSSLYGMALERRYPHDFADWPFSYEQLAPWYTKAETLYEVSGTADPLRPAEPSCPEPAVPLSPANERVFTHLRNRGLHPYRLHLGSRREPGCRTCQSYLCDSDNGCKRDAGSACLLPALATGNARLLTGARLLQLKASNGRVHTAIATHNGSPIQITARLFVLAAGALSSPRILLRSALANRSGLIGRRLMRHAIDLFILTLGPRFRHPAESKELALNDYHGGPGAIDGTIQSFGMPPPFDYVRRQPGRNLWRRLGPLGKAIYQHVHGMPIVASILADSPDPANYVREDAAGPHYFYRLPPADSVRRQRLRKHTLGAFARFAPIPVFGTSDRKALGHVCGTVVAGRDPATSVLDANNRAHDLDNLYVVDASFFPTSGAVNPALTIMANALRVADHVHREVL